MKRCVANSILRALFVAILAAGGMSLGCAKQSAASPTQGGATDAVAPAPRAAPPDRSEGAEGTKVDQSATLEAARTVATEIVETRAEPPSAPQRPPADRTPTRPGDAEKITFDDLNLGMQADVVFRPFMLTDRVKELEGKQVSIVGYMHGAQLSQRGIKKFVLLKNTQCKFGPGGQADHLAQVLLQAGATTELTPSPVKVEGTLKVEPFVGVDGNTWAIYNLEEAKIR